MKKRLLFVTNGLYGGGAERILHTVLLNLSPEKYEITLYSVNREFLDFSFPAWIHYRYIFNCPVSSSFINKFLIKIENKVKLLIYNHFPITIFYHLFIRGLYDTEIAFLEGYSTRIIAGSGNPKSQKLAWVHTDFLQNHWSKIAYRSSAEEERCYNAFDKVYCVSSSVRDALLKLYPSLKNLDVMYNPVDVDQIRSLSRQEVSIRLVDNERIRLLSVGRLVPQKGYDRLLPIIKRLHEEGISCSLVILGEGPARGYLQSIIKDNGMESYAHILGFQTNPYPYYKGSDLFVCSSRAEGYSTVVTEALIIGLPVLSTECSGMRELLGDNEYGIIVPNEDEALYLGLKELLLDQSRLNYYRTKAIERGNMFNLSEMIDRFEQII